MLCRPLHSEELFMPTWAPLSAALAGHQWAAGRVCSAVISAAAWITIGGQARDVFLRYGALICEQNIDGKEIDWETCANLHRDINMLGSTRVRHICHVLLLERGGRWLDKSWYLTWQTFCSKQFSPFVFQVAGDVFSWELRKADLEKWFEVVRYLHLIFFPVF